MIVELDDKKVLDELMNRIYDYWWDKKNEVRYALFEKYYQDCIDSGIFEGIKFDVMQIVDNDWVKFNSYDSEEEAREDFDYIDWCEERILARLDKGEVLVDPC